MHVSFEPDTNLGPGEISIAVRAADQTPAVTALIHDIHHLVGRSRTVLPVRTNDRVLMLKYQNIILIEVNREVLTITTTDQTITTRGHLYQIAQELSPTFVQVSRYAILNLDHLQALEAGFSGAMVARLSANHRTTVSRRYLKQLEQRLGI